MRINAVIFDLDGTVLSDEDEYGEAFNRVLKKFGVETKSVYPHVAGIGVNENWAIFLKKYDIKTEKSLDELGIETQKEYLRLLPKVRFKKGFKSFCQKLKEAGVKLALATSNNFEIVGKIFDTLDLNDFFDSVTTGEEVSLKKPSPQIFLLTAEKLGIDPKDCLVIEDSVAGIEAAYDAGMKVIALARNQKHKEKLKSADLVVSGFDELSIEKIDNLFDKRV